MDFKEQVTGYGYDTLGRLEYKRYYAADATAGDFLNSHYPSTPAEVLQYTYDNLGRKLTETVTDYAGTPTVTYYVSYSYDDEGNVTAIVTPQGTVNYDYYLTTGRKSFTRKGSELATEYGYDELGRLKTTRAMVRNGLLLSPTELTTYEYDLVGNRKSATLPNGVYTEYSYNGLNRLTELVHYQTTGRTTVVGSYSYQLSAAGMRKGAGEFLAYPSGSQSPVVEYDYDGLNRLVGESNKHEGTTGFEAGYVYDLVGNRLGRTVIAPNDTLDTTYDYYPGTDRLYHEYQAGPVAAIPFGQNETVYAYHTPSGGLSYQMPGEAGRIGALTAFLYGVPSVWGIVLLVSLLICLPVAGLWPVLVRILRRQAGGPRPSLSIYHRCLCVLLAYVFLIGPECLLYLSQAATQYSQISTLAWGRGNSIITYGYDANGSLTSKTTTCGGQTTESVVYTYNLQNRLARVETTPYTGGVAGAVTAVDYAYNPDGIRVGKTETTPVGTTATAYLIDPANPTGYAQVLEETTARYDAADVLWSVERTDYVIGEDVISQTKSNCDLSTNAWTANATQYLLYDGHGSTRQLMNANLTVQDSYSYDGYGVMLGSTADSANAAQTNLLYCGEQYDSALSQYYLRARYYNPANGLFNQLDPYAGNMQDPQSLHKYLYCHANPVNGVDPSGKFTISNMLVTAGISGLLSSSFVSAYGYAKGWSGRQIAKAAGYAFLTGAIAGAFAYGAAAGIAAGAMAAGVTAGEAAAVGWSTVGLIGGPAGVGLSIANLSEAIENGDNVDKSFAIVNLGLASLGFIASHWSAFNMTAGATAAKIPQSTVNRIAGLSVEDDFIANAQANGFTVVGQHVRVKTPFSPYWREIDVVLRGPNSDLNFGVEVKSSIGAINRNDAAACQQFAADRWINQYGAEAIGKDKGLVISGTSKILWRPEK